MPPEKPATINEAGNTALDKNKRRRSGFNWFGALDIIQTPAIPSTTNTLDKIASQKKGKGRPLKSTPALTAEIIRLQQDGASNAAIKRVLALQFGISEKTVGRVITKLRN